MPKTFRLPLPLPTSDYYTIVKMSNHAVVGVFRQHVFARRSSRRYAPPIPEEHDFYCVKRTPDRVMVQIFHDGNEVYRCIFCTSCRLLTAGQS